MHRSSTSLITQFLQRCGLFLGGDLLGPHKDNLDGYFEHAGLVAVHNEIISVNGHNIFTMPGVIEYSESSKNRLMDIDRSLQAANINSSPFGYKDPRSCLFIEAINHIFPDSFHLMIFREHTQVVDSLIRRSTDRELKYNPWLASKAWYKYNRQLLQFREKNASKTLFVNDAFVIEKSDEFIELLNFKFDLQLQQSAMTDIYKPKLTKRSGEPKRKTKIALFPFHAKLNAIESQLYLECAADYNALKN